MSFYVYSVIVSKEGVFSQRKVSKLSVSGSFLFQLMKLGGKVKEDATGAKCYCTKRTCVCNSVSCCTLCTQNIRTADLHKTDNRTQTICLIRLFNSLRSEVLDISSGLRSAQSFGIYIVRA